MQKKLTITIDEEIYQGLYEKVGAGKISSFIELLLRQHIMDDYLESAYAQMSQDAGREEEAHSWAENTLGDIENETR